MPPKLSKSPASTIGVVFIVAGILIAIGQNFDPNFGRLTWPLYIIVPGMALLAISLGSKFGNKVLTTLGTTTLSTGLLLAYQNAFNYFENWAYAWALEIHLPTVWALVLRGGKLKISNCFRRVKK